MKIKKLSFFITVLFILHILSLPSFSMSEKQFSALFFINQVYQLILINYYEPPSGAELLNSAILYLSSETGEKSSIYLPTEDLNDEEAFREFENIFMEITEDYAGDFQDLSINISIAMIASLNDKYSSFLFIQDCSSLEDILSDGTVSGLGFVLNNEEDLLFVKIVFPDSPAYFAGIRKGDIIVEIDDIPVKGKTQEEIYSLLGKKENEKIKLKIFRENSSFTVSLEVEQFVIRDFFIENMDDNVLYLKINYFSRHIYEELDAELRKIDLKVFSGIILDLRDNPGGDYENALAVSELFIESEKTIISFKSNRGFDSIYSNNFSPVFNPLVVLINNDTMSSAEIVAVSLKNNKRAFLVGDRTFGKGLVQGFFPLEGGYGLSLSVKELFGPGEKSFNNCGIEPDFYVKAPEEQIVKALDLIRNN